MNCFCDSEEIVISPVYHSKLPSVDLQLQLTNPANEMIKCAIAWFYTLVSSQQLSNHNNVGPSLAVPTLIRFNCFRIVWFLLISYYVTKQMWDSSIMRKRKTVTGGVIIGWAVDLHPFIYFLNSPDRVKAFMIFHM